MQQALMQGVHDDEIVRWLANSPDWGGTFFPGGTPTFIALATPAEPREGEILPILDSRDASTEDVGKILQYDGSSALTYTIQQDTFSRGDRLAFALTGSGGSIIVAYGGTAVVRTAKTLTLSTRYGMALLTVLGDRGNTPQEHLLTGEMDES